jgi:ribosomal protein S18 acetylase RimI-like enzyme
MFLRGLGVGESLGGSTGSALQLRQLDWDTDFFGARMGAIVPQSRTRSSVTSDNAREASLLERQLLTVLRKADLEGFAHVILRVAAEDLPLAWAAERSGLRLVDIAVDSSFSLEPAALPDPDPAVLIRPANPDDVPRLREIAGQAFVFSRFAADPYFSSAQVVAFYEQWMTNLCAGLAEVVLVCEQDRRVIGFVSCALDNQEGRIPLIAADASVRRHGIGRGLIVGALRWFLREGASIVRVKTQATNYPALALYHRAGFLMSRTELTFSATPGASVPRER